MCGRYRLGRGREAFKKYFGKEPDEDWSPRYNIAPTQQVPVIRQHPKEPRRDLSLMRWGLIPSWSKDMSGAARMINARSETAHTLPAFREAMKLRRCLVPADGFYEWQRRGSAKQPFCFEVNGGEVFAFAGLWERWRDPGGQWIESCSILTTTPNAVTSAAKSATDNCTTLTRERLHGKAAGGSSAAGYALFIRERARRFLCIVPHPFGWKRIHA